MKRALLVAVVIALAAACTHHAPPVTPTPPIPVGCVAVLVHDDVRPIVGATVQVDGQTVATDERGYRLFQTRVGPLTIHVEAPDYEPRDVSYTAPVMAPGACDIDIPLTPVFHPLPALHVDGRFFKLPNGDRWIAIETSDFSLFARWLDGEDITPVLEQRNAIGFNTLRVWTRFCNIPGIAGCSTLAKHPDLYDRLPAFLRVLATRGFYVDLLAYVGPNNETDPQHWSRLCNAVRGPPLQTSVLLSLVNENDVHPIDLTPFQPCAGVLSSRGSNGSQAWPPNDDLWQWGEFHDNQAPEWWRKGGHNAWEVANGNHYPVITNEQTGAENDGNPAHWEDVGKGIALFVAGGAFHSAQGKDSTVFTGAALDAARAFVKGMTAVPLDCRELDYHCPSCDNPSAWIPPFLRVYRFGSDDRCLVTVRP